MEEEKGPQNPIAEPAKHTTHTYEDDLAKALDATDAKVVQEIITEGKAKEAYRVEEQKRERQKKWYRLGACILFLFAGSASIYTFYYYKGLTVPAERPVSVGVFPSTTPITVDTTDIRKVVETLKGDATISEKPALVPLIKDEASRVQLSVPELFSFFESKPSEPFLASFTIARLGIVRVGTDNVPFVIASVANPEISSKELLIAEPDLLKIFYKALGIDLAGREEVIGKSFSGEYIYNIPIRALRYDTLEERGKLIFFYARASDQIVVFTTRPEALKAVYDSIIRQQS